MPENCVAVMVRGGFLLTEFSFGISRGCEFKLLFDL